MEGKQEEENEDIEVDMFPTVSNENVRRTEQRTVKKRKRRSGTGTTKKKSSKAVSTRECMSTAAIRRQAIRAGVKRVSNPIYAESRAVLKQYLRTILAETIKITDHSKRRTIKVEDVLYAMSRHHVAIHDFGF